MNLIIKMFHNNQQEVKNVVQIPHNINIDNHIKPQSWITSNNHITTFTLENGAK